MYSRGNPPVGRADGSVVGLLVDLLKQGGLRLTVSGCRAYCRLKPRRTINFRTRDRGGGSIRCPLPLRQQRHPVTMHAGQACHPSAPIATPCRRIRDGCALRSGLRRRPSPALSYITAAHADIDPTSGLRKNVVHSEGCRRAGVLFKESRPVSAGKNCRSSGKEPIMKKQPQPPKKNRPVPSGSADRTAASADRPSDSNADRQRQRQQQLTEERTGSQQAPQTGRESVGALSSANSVSADPHARTKSLGAPVPQVTRHI